MKGTLCIVGKCISPWVEAVFDACRVDGKDVVSVPQRRLSFDCKTSKPVFSLHGDIIGRGGEDVEKVSRMPAPRRFRFFWRQIH